MTVLAHVPETDVGPRVIAGKYRLETLLGEGGMGSIWRAFNLQLEIPVAIKLLRPGPNSEELSERLRVEARAAAKLAHPSIVRVFDIGEAESGEPFIVMELLNGESLGEVLERGVLPAVNAVQLLLPIAEALSLAHSRGVVHRDLKPDNIFLAREGDALQPKLLDFGIAKVTSTLAAGGATLTQTGVLLGSPDYMSPEQAYGRPDIDQRSDIWSFCVVLYEAISGATPFSGTTTQNILRSVVQDAPLPLDVLANVDARLSDLVMNGLAKDRDDRPASIFELGRALALWLRERGVENDATGASLETKWLGRSSDTLRLTHPKSLGSPLAQHEQATLVSVVHPRPLVSTAPAALLPPRRRRRLVSSVAAAAILLACFGWATTRELQRRGFGRDLPAFASSPAPSSALPAAALAPPSTVDALAPPSTVDALAVEAPARDPRAAVSDEPPAVGLPRSPLAAEPARPPTQLHLAATTPTPRPLGSQPSLPQALPVRDPADDLIEPY
jgi:serine/threonine-protein kinase